MKHCAVLVVGWLLLCVAAPAGAAPAYAWPLAPRPPVTRGFDPPAQHWQSGHRGVDLGAAEGAAVRAAGTGTVRFAGEVAGRGTVTVVHPSGIATTYEPLDPVVQTGQTVQRGQLLGHLVPGHPGCNAGTCLHWGARRGAGHDPRYLNPLALVGAVRVRLKPLGAGE